MTTSQASTPHKAKISRKKTISAIWLIPFIALCIGLWMVYYQWQSQGTIITINMVSAAGLETNKTKIKTRNVDIGVVKSIALRKDLDGVLVSVEINKESVHLLTENTQIWVVSPRISTEGISGLNTILSGIYIELSPGDSKISRDHFMALESPPITPAGTPGQQITLTSLDQTAYSVGDVVLYKGLTVGRFESVNFNILEKKIHYSVFIKAPYHHLISKNTRFWNISGLNVGLSANGINVQTSSIQSLLTNSITFDDFNHLPSATLDKQQLAFYIYPDKKSAIAPIYQHSVEYIVLVSDTVRGLNIGAPVEYRGINIGEVTAVNYHPNGEKPIIDRQYKIPVLISIQVGKLGLEDSVQAIEQVATEHASWIKQGLRAKLQSGNLLTGQLFINLQHYPDEPESEISYFENHLIIPSVLDNFTLLTQSSEQLLNKLNALPLKSLTTNASTMIQSFNDTAQSLKSVSNNLETLLSDVNKQQLVQNLNSMLDATADFASSYSSGSKSNEEILGSLNKLNSLMASVEALTDNYAAGSEGQDTLDQTLKGFNSLIREIQPLLLELNRKPNSLIFPSKQAPNIQPKARTK